jgi:prepilin-type N-terminal cleavage/methylation domain-containing protein
MKVNRHIVRRGGRWPATINRENPVPAGHATRNTQHASPATRHSSLVTRCAFTLIEVMVAMAIFAIVVAAIYSTWLLVVRASLVGQQTAARTQRQRVALRTIEDSLSCIQSYQASIQYYYFDVENGDQPFLSFTAQLPDVFPRNARFGGVNLRRLTFNVQPGKDLANDLVLRQNPVLMDMDLDEQQTPLVLAHDVKTFAVECWDPAQGEWLTEWDNTNTIPTALLVTIALNNGHDPGSSVTSVTRLIAIPSTTLPSGLQGSASGAGAAPPGAGVPFNPRNLIQH